MIFTAFETCPVGNSVSGDYSADSVDELGSVVIV